MRARRAGQSTTDVGALLAAVVTWPLMRDLIKTVVLGEVNGILATIAVVVVIWMLWPVAQYSWDALGKLRRHRGPTATILDGVHRGPKIRHPHRCPVGAAPDACGFARICYHRSLGEEVR